MSAGYPPGVTGCEEHFETMKCNQEGCQDDAAYRFTWPGKDEAGICEGHAPKLRGIAGAMGMHVQLIPLD